MTENQDLEEFPAPVTTKYPEGMLGVKWAAAYEALSRNEFNRTHACDELKISIRSLRKWIRHMRESGIVIPDNPKKPRVQR